MKSILLIALSIFSTSAFAVETSLCPSRVTLSLTNVSAYGKSVADGIPGWTEARDVLRANAQDREIVFELKSRKSTTCFYVASTGETATAMSVLVGDHDPEVPGPYEIDAFLVNLPWGGLTFTLFPEIAEMTREGGLKIYNQNETHRHEVRTKLARPSDGKRIHLDVGSARIETN